MHSSEDKDTGILLSLHINVSLGENLFCSNYLIMKFQCVIRDCTKITREELGVTKNGGKLSQISNLF